MPTVSITNSLIAKLKPKDKVYDVRDSRLKGFMVRVHPTGNMSYVIQYARGQRINLGRVGVLMPPQAREKAIKVLADYARGCDPQQAKKQKQGTPTLKVFINKDYGPWIKTHNISGSEALKTIDRHFSYLFDRPLDQIKVRDIEKWRIDKLKKKTMKMNTINRTITSLRSAISKAVEWGVIKEHSFSGLKTLKCDDTRIRYLGEDEKKRLLRALEAREERLKKNESEQTSGVNNEDITYTRNFLKKNLLII